MRGTVPPLSNTSSRRGAQVSTSPKYELLYPCPDRFWGPPSLLMGTEGFVPGIKRPGREAVHSPQCSADVKNAWNCSTTPQYVFMAWLLIKAQDQL